MGANELVVADSHPVQYLGYCTVCNFFNPSHSIDLMLKNWTAQSHTSAIRVTLLFLCSFNFSSLSSSRLPLFKNFKNSLFQPNMPQNLSLSLSLSLSCLKKKPPVMLQLPLHRRMNVNQQCFSYPPKCD